MTTTRYPADNIGMTPFMGIALADILANGVAIIMLLIIITISTEYQLEQEKLEQVDEISQVLSRDIASSVVMNNLSTSPPAVLHDYAQSGIDTDLRHAVMPILELRKQGVRDYYSGYTWSRQQLLLQDNDFDTYLKRLDDNQRLRLRTDIYEIDMFYIYMSILKDQNIDPKHWHFSVAKPGGERLATAPPDRTNNWAELFTRDNGDELGAELSGGSQTIADARLGQSFDSSDYPWDSLSNGDQQQQNTDSALQQGSQLRFRLAAPADQMQFMQSNLELSDDNGKNILVAALSYLKFINDKLEQGHSVVNEVQNMIQHLQEFIQQPMQLSAYEQQTIEQVAQAQLRRQLIGALDKTDELTIEYQQQDDFRGLGVALPTNQALATMSIIGTPGQADYMAKLPAYGKAHFHLQHYPELFRGLSLEFLPQSIMLLADYAPSQQWRWYPVFFIYPEFDDFVMGFIYAKVPQSGQIVLAAESNYLTVGGYSLQLQRSEAPAESEHLLAIVFGLVLAVFLLIYVVLLWQRRSAFSLT